MIPYEPMIAPVYVPLANPVVNMLYKRNDAETMKIESAVPNIIPSIMVLLWSSCI